ncbi:MAG: multiheme c-type cytochrome [Desulfuromonadales bacterium]
MKRKFWFRPLVVVGLLLAVLAFAGCEGDDGNDGATGPAGPAGPAGGDGVDASSEVTPESCAVCHADSGDEHQAFYDQLNQDEVIQVAGVTYAFVEGSTTVTFEMTKNAAPFDCTQADNLNIYWVGADFMGNPALAAAEGRTSLKGTITYDSGVCTSVSTTAALEDYSAVNGLIVVYGYDEQVGSLPPSRVRLVKYPYAALYETGAGVSYESAANNDGCEKCHSVPYLKHGNIYGQVEGDPATDFLTCKVCHFNDGEGGHFEWQLAVDDPALWVKFAEGTTTDAENTAIAAKYAYETNLMNDVHMSHAMEFPYPQSMANCVTCHEGKLDSILTDENFVLETCKSCHPMTGGTDSADADGNFAYDFRDLALTNIITHGFDETSDCAACHRTGGIGPRFNAIHTGYNTAIFDATGVKYADEISVSIDDATYNSETYLLTVDFSATGVVGSFDSADIVPTLLVGLYGYDTKDYLVGPHARDIDSDRNLELKFGGTNPRVSISSSAAGSWTATADLSYWADQINDGTLKRAEIGIMPDLGIALNAVSKTFDLTANDFDDYFSPIVNVEEGCNNCHEALATTFHSPDRGGSIEVCRLCHITLSGGSHLEMQSRSIDSYVHAIHSFQAFDPGDVDFTDPVEALHYEDHTELFPYPTHGIENCESCHVDGAYNVPDQSKSLPGLHSASDTLNKDRNIGAVPSYVTGPASRACGGCHRAQMINEDAAGDLAAFNSHTKTFGYLVENDEGVLDNVIDTIMAFFK